MKIRKNDRVIVLAGKDKGKIGKVLRVLPAVDRVIVEGINKIKRHTKPNQQEQAGGIIEKEASLHASNVSLLTKDNKPTRIGFRFIEADQNTPGKKKKKKIRIARSTGEDI